MFDINPTDGVPIWRQIEEGMRRMVAMGSLEPGTPVPSVRELAQRLRVNPNTVARAYQRLTDSGLFAVRRGEGTFVAETPSKLKKTERSGALRDAATRYAGTALAVGASIEEMQQEVAAAHDRLVKEQRRKA